MMDIILSIGKDRLNQMEFKAIEKMQDAFRIWGEIAPAVW